MFDLAWLNPIVAFASASYLRLTCARSLPGYSPDGDRLLWMPSRWQDINRSKLLQPLYDIIKLFSKQTIIPHTASALFIWSPILACICALAVTLFVPVAGNSFDYSFSLVVVFYLLVFVTLFVIIGRHFQRLALRRHGRRARGRADAGQRDTVHLRHLRPGDHL